MIDSTSSVFNAQLTLHLTVLITNVKYLYNHQNVQLEPLTLMILRNVYVLMQDLGMIMELFVLHVKHHYIGVRTKEYADNAKMEKFTAHNKILVYHVQMINQYKEMDNV